jgi:hypothetical protein
MASFAFLQLSRDMLRRGTRVAALGDDEEPRIPRSCMSERKLSNPSSFASPDSPWCGQASFGLADSGLLGRLAEEMYGELAFHHAASSHAVTLSGEDGANALAGEQPGTRQRALDKLSFRRRRGNANAVGYRVWTFKHASRAGEGAMSHGSTSMRTFVPGVTLFACGLVFAAFAQQSPSSGPSSPSRQKMAEAYQAMATCLRSTKPFEECRSEMWKNCQSLMGKEGCPMMGGGRMAPGMMGSSMMQNSQPNQEPAR